jgi:hypothetical protein
MAAPSYTTDLTLLDDCADSTGWAEPTATNWTSLNVVTSGETDYFIEGSACNSATVKTGVGGLLYNNGAGVTIPTDGAFLCWVYWGAPNCLDTEANGGIRLVIGSSLSAFYAVKSGGKDLAPNPYGGWMCLAMADPGAITPDYTVGSPSSTRQYFGWCYNAPTAVPSKGNPFGVDICRYGRCEMRINSGDLANGYATFAGFATQNDSTSNRWGLFQNQGGSFLWQGLMTLGYSSAVDFRDSNVVIMIANTKKVTANFNKIEVRQATSRVDWTNVTFISLGTVSKGRFECIDDADVNISGCTFQGMDTFIFKSVSEVLTSTFLNCGIVTANSAKFNGTKFTGFTGAADSSQLVWDTNVDLDGKIDGCTFTKGTNATHAIQLGTTSPTTVTIRNCAFSGYNAANANNDSTFLVSRTTGTVTINVVGCTGNLTYKTAGATVVIASNPVSATVTVKDTAVPPVAIQNARVLVLAYSGGPMPYNVTVTITNSGTTATVSHTSHGMATNDKVQITGASLAPNNGVFSITKINDNSYSYTMGSSPGSNPTGTIKATFAVLEGLTDANGQITMSRSFTSSQPITGRARQGSSAPYKKTTDFTGTVDSSTGLNVTVQLLPDV